MGVVGQVLVLAAAVLVVKLCAGLVQAGKDGTWNDEMLVVHVTKSKEKDKEKWDHGSAVIADLHTALQPYKHDVYDLEVRHPRMLCYRQLWNSNSLLISLLNMW